MDIPSPNLSQSPEQPEALNLEASESPPKPSDVPDSSKSPEPGTALHPEIESANEADISSDNCSNLYLGKLVSDTEDDENYDVITGDVNEDARRAAAEDSNDDVTDDVIPESGSARDYAIMRQDPLTSEKFVPIDKVVVLNSPKLEEGTQTAFVPLASHQSSSGATPKQTAKNHSVTLSTANKVPDCVGSDQCITCNPQIEAKPTDDNRPSEKVERSLRTFAERSAGLEDWLKNTENTVIEVSGLLNSELLKKEKIQGLISDLLKKEIVVKSMNRMGTEVSQEILKIDHKTIYDVIQTVMQTLNQRWQTVVNLVHSMETNLSPRSTDVIVSSDVTPRSNTASLTPSITPSSTTVGTKKMEAKPSNEQGEFLKGRLSALATSNQESVQDWYHLRSDLSFELKKLVNFKMLYHYPAMPKPIPVQYCNKHWHEYLSGTRPISVASNPDSRKYPTKNLSSQGSRMNPHSPISTRSVSAASRSYTPYVPSRKSRSIPRSQNQSYRSLSPTSSYGDLEHSRDSEVDDLIEQANNLHVPPPPPPPISLNPDQFIAYKMPCMFRCQYCGQTQPVFLPESGVPIITIPDGQNLPSGTCTGTNSHPLTSATSQDPKLDVSDSNLRKTAKNPSDKPTDLKTISFKPNGITFIPSQNSVAPSGNPTAPVAYFAPSCNNSNPIPVSNNFPVLKMPKGSVPPGSQILIIPPGGTPGSNPTPSGLGYPNSKFSSNIPPDLQKIMEKYGPKAEEDDDKPSREQLVADALNRFEEKKKKKEKDDYLNSLKDKRNQPKNDKDKKKSALHFPIDSDDEIIADPSKQKELHSSNPFGFDDFGPNAPNAKSLRELELAATAAAKWWEKTKKRLDDEKKSGKRRAKSKSPINGRSGKSDPLIKKSDLPVNQKSGLPGEKDAGSPSPSKLRPKFGPTPSFKGKSNIPSSDDECVAQFPNRQKLESALDGLDFLDDKPVDSNKSKNKPSPDNKNNNKNKNIPTKTTTPTLKPPKIEIPGESSVESTPRPGSRPKLGPDQPNRPGSSLGAKRKVAPTTPRNFTPRVQKVDKDSDVESLKNGFTPQTKPEVSKPKDLDLKSIQRAADASAKWLDNVTNQPKPKTSPRDPKRPGDSKTQPKINMPDEDEDEILTAMPTKSLFSAPPPLITKNPTSTASLLSDPDSLDAPPSARSERSHIPLTSPESQNGLFSPPNPIVSPYPGMPQFGPGNPGAPGRPGSNPGPGGGGLVNFGNVNMYIMQTDPNLNKQALDQADKMPAVIGQPPAVEAGPQNNLPAIKNVSSPDGEYAGNVNAYRQRPPRSNTSTPSQEKQHNPARPFQAFSGNQFQDNFEQTTPHNY